MHVPFLLQNVPELAEEYNVSFTSVLALHLGLWFVFFFLSFQVTAVPSVVAIKAGKVEGSFVGVLDDDKLRAFVNKLIGE